jgi:hypothetical protein
MKKNTLPFMNTPELTHAQAIEPSSEAKTSTSAPGQLSPPLTDEQWGQQRLAWLSLSEEERLRRIASHGTQGFGLYQQPAGA